MLVNIIRKKDKELEQFKLEKLEISRSNIFFFVTFTIYFCTFVGELKTEKFDWTQVESAQENMLEKVFTKEQSSKFWKKFTEIHGQTKSTTLQLELFCRHRVNLLINK